MTFVLRRIIFLLGLGIAIVAVIGLMRFDVLEDALNELQLPLRHENVIRQEADDEDLARLASGAVSLPPIEPELIAAVIYAESKFRDQTSSAGARGLMQITPDTAEVIEDLSGGTTFEYEDLADPDLNIRYGTFYLRYLLHRFGGNVVAALAAYNAGETNVAEWGGSALDAGDIRFPETREYVRGILEKRAEYRREYGEELGIG